MYYDKPSMMERFHEGDEDGLFNGQLALVADSDTRAELREVLRHVPLSEMTGVYEQPRTTTDEHGHTKIIPRWLSHRHTVKVTPATRALDARRRYYYAKELDEGDLVG